MTTNRVNAATNTGPPIVTRTRGDNSGDVGASVLVTMVAGVDTDVSTANPLPVADAAAATALASLATQATLAAVLAKLIAAPATETTLASILSGLSSLATSAAQSTAQTSLSAIVTALGPLATQTTVAAILSALQGSLTVGLPSGAATSAAQGTAQTSLSSLDTKTPALGQALAAASSPVVLTAAQDVVAYAPAKETGGHLATIDTSTATTATQSTTTATNTGTLAGAVSGGKVLTTETSASAIATSTATTATQTTTTATNTGTIAGAVSAGRVLTTEASAASILAKLDVALSTRAVEAGGNLAAILTKFTDGLQRAGILGSNGSAIAGATNPLDVRPSADGTNPVDATHGLYVRPGTSTLWDVIDRAGRLVGALTGVNGSSIATLANPVPVQLADNSGNSAGATGGWDTTGIVSMPVGGLVIKASAGVFTQYQATNGTPGAAFLQIHNLAAASGLSTNTIIWVGNSTSVGIIASANAASGGVKGSTGLVAAWSTTALTYTAPASNTGTGIFYYR